MKSCKAAFFDRDGTLIEDVSYLSCVSQIKPIISAIELCKFFFDNDYKIFIVTNQSGVARGFFDEAKVIEINNYLENMLLEYGIKITKSYYCPHHATQAKINIYKVDCKCRKPNPGMILEAASTYNINLEQSFMIGDKKSDVESGVNAGAKGYYIQDILKEKLACGYLNINEKIGKVICE